MGLGEHGRARQGRRSSPSSGCRRRGAARIRDFGTRLGWEDMFETTFDVRDYEEAVPFQTAAGLEVTRSACRTTRCARTACGCRTAITRSRTRATPAPTTGSTEVARDADLFVCEATLARGELDGSPRGHLSVDEAVAAFEASGAKRLLLTHRPDELPRAGRLRARLRRARHRALSSLLFRLEWVRSSSCRDRGASS